MSGSPYAYQSGTGGGTSSASSGTGKNYLGTVNTVNGNGDFELGSTTKWTLGTTGTLTNGLPTGSPSFGSGANAATTITAVNSSPLAANWSMDFATTGSSPNGNMFASDAFTIDLEDQAKVMTVKFYYKAQVNPANGNWSGTSSNTYAWAVYDVTNSAWIIPAGAFGMTQSSGIGYCTGTFQTSSSGTQYRFVVYLMNTSGTITARFDDFFLGPQTAPFGPVVTDWVSYTPVFTGFGSPSGISGRSRRVGDTLEVFGSCTTGVVTATAATVTLGFNGVSGNVTTDSTVIAASLVGQAGYSTNNTTLFDGGVLANPNLTTVAFSRESSTTSILAASSGSAIVGSSTAVSFNAKVKIAGWSSTVSMSNDTDTRVVAFRSTSQPTGTVNSSVNIAVFVTPQTDTHAAYSAGTYTIPVSGIFDVQAGVEIDATFVATQNAIIYLYKNGAEIGRFSGLAQGTTAALFVPLSVTGISCNAGDTLNIRTSTTGGGSPGYGGSNCFFSLNRISGPSVIAATESVNARYYASATSISGSLATVVWTTKDFDSHNALVSGVFTVPVTGKYQVNTAMALSGTIVLNNTVDLQLQKNGVAVSEDLRYAGGALTNFDVGLEDIISCVAGDTIRVQVSSSATAPSIVSSNSRNYISITRVGN